jgi:hypothetical protein
MSGGLHILDPYEITFPPSEAGFVDLETGRDSHPALGDRPVQGEIRGLVKGYETRVPG